MNIYRVKMNDTEFFSNSNKIVACSISVSNGQVFFKTDKITINYLKSNKIQHELLDSTYHKIKKNIFINKGIVFGILLFIAILVINQYRVSEIRFNEDFVINSDIEKQINNDVKKLFFWDFYGGNLDTTALNIRKQYVNYQWISIDKRGSVISVVINNYDESSIDKDELVIGDIVARKDGIIKYYNIFNGGRNVEVNKYVKQGDILISSNLLINTGLDKQDLTEARGLVLANTYEEIQYRVLKEEKTTIFTSKKKKYTQLNIFNSHFNINKKGSFNNYNKKETVTFNLFGIFAVKKIEEFEKYDIIKTYTKEEAIELLKTMIENDFNTTKTSDLEEIERMEVVAFSEDKNGYDIRILVKRLESIGEFRQFSE